MLLNVLKRYILVLYRFMRTKLRTIGVKKYFYALVIVIFLMDLAILLNIPYIRQILGFLFLTILPGLLILQVLKLNKLNTIETILYSVGLSIAFVMLTGFFMNMLYPPLGFSKPISTLPLMITISIILLILSVINYLKNKDFSISIPISVGELLSPPVLFLVLLPILAILGALLVTFYGTNAILLLLIILISLSVILATFDIIPTKLFPLAIFMIALALLLHRALVPFYLPNGDIHIEYYFYKLVETNSYWDLTISSNYNAMLSVVMLPTIYSKLLNIDGVWIFKVIYSLIFSLVPLALYQVYREQTTEKAAFLAAFFFMSMYCFFYTIPTLCRQEIAELFYVLVIMLLLSKEMNRLKRATLFIIFGGSLVVSHYGLSYIFVFQIVIAMLLLYGAKNVAIINLKENLYNKFNKFRSTNPIAKELRTNLKNTALNNTITLSMTLVLLYFVFALAWYIYISSSSTFNAIVNIGEHMYNSILTEFLNPTTREPEVLAALGMGTPITYYLSYISRPIHYATQFFIIVGLVRLIIKYKEMKFEREYIAMLLVSSALIFACIVIPTFSERLNTERTYHIALILVAPLCILGGETVFKYIFKPFRSISLRRSTCAKILLIILIPYFLFNTGFAWELAGEKTAKPLGLERYKTGDDLDKAIFYISVIQKEDIFGAKWLGKNRVDNSIVYTGWSSKWYLLTPYAMIRRGGGVQILGGRENLMKDSFVFLRYFNVKENLILIDYTTEGMVISKTTEISHQFFEKNKIYSNGGSEIYR